TSSTDRNANGLRILPEPEGDQEYRRKLRESPMTPNCSYSLGSTWPWVLTALCFSAALPKAPQPSLPDSNQTYLCSPILRRYPIPDIDRDHRSNFLLLTGHLTEAVQLAGYAAAFIPPPDVRVDADDIPSFVARTSAVLVGRLSEPR